MFTVSDVKAHVNNFLFDVSLVPTFAEIKYKSWRVSMDPDYINKLREKEAKKEQAKKDDVVIKEARKEANMDKKDDMSESIHEHIDEMSKNGEALTKVASMISKGIDTHVLVQFAYYYMTNNDAKLVEEKFNSVEKEIINGIGNTVGFGKIYKDAATANLFNYDPDRPEYNPSSKYIISIRDVEKKKCDTAFMEKMNNRIQKMIEIESQELSNGSSAGSSWSVGSDGNMHPIWFPKDGKPINILEQTNTLPIKGEGISDELFEKMEKVVLPCIGLAKHRYMLNPNETVSLFITREEYGFEELYILDTGNIMGKGKIYVLANLANDTLFVSLEDHADICTRVLSNALYRLNDNEVQLVVNDYFRNMNIYKYVDMSYTEKMNELTTSDFQKLGKKLTFIINQLASNNDGSRDLPRFRFNLFDSVDDFMIISDYDVKSPLSGTNETSNEICEGLIFEVKDDDVSQIYQTTRVEFHITKYGEM